MKKIFSLCMCVLLAGTILVGCTTNPPASSLTTYISHDNIWEYYDEYLNVADNFEKSLMQAVVLTKNDDNIADADAQKYLSVNTNSQYYKNTIRDCVAVIDVFENSEKQALFEFDNASDYMVKHLSSNAGYKVTYNQKIQRNTILEQNAQVDQLIYNVPLCHELTINLEKGDTGVYNIKTILQNITFPESISAFEEITTNQDGNTVTTKLEVTQNQITTPIEYTQTTLLASQVITNSNGSVLYSYERESKYYLQNNHFYLRDTTKVDGTLKLQQNIRLDNSYSNVALNYNKQTGNLNYNLTYNLAGSLNLYGEMYYQGKNKFICKEFVNITQGTPFGLTQNFITETNYAEIILTKTVYNVGVYVNIRDQEMQNFAVHTNDGSSVCAKKAEGKIDLTFYS